MTKFFSLCLALTCATAAVAAEDGLFAPNQLLSVEALVEATLARNAGLEAARSAAAEADFNVAPAGRLDDPMIAYSLAPETLDGIGRRSGGTRGFNQRVEVEQALPWPGKLPLRAQAMRHEAQAQHAETDDAALAAVSAAKSAYARWIYVHRALTTNVAQQEWLAHLKAVAETRYAAGIASQQDAIQAALERVRAQQEALGLERERRTVQAEINGLLNRLPQAALPKPSPIKDSLRDPETLALSDSHPELEALAARLKGSKAQVHLAEKAFNPDFRVQTAYDSFWDEPDQRWSVGLAFNVPLDRGKYRAWADAARAAESKQRWQLVDRRSRLGAERENARAMASESYRTIALYRDSLIPLARQNASAALADYEAGSGEFTAVIEAERAKLDAELGLEKAHTDYLGRMAELERLQGEVFAASDTSGETHHE